MEAHHALDDVAISATSQRLLRAVLAENPRLGGILGQACSYGEALAGVRRWVEDVLADSP